MSEQMAYSRFADAKGQSFSVQVGDEHVSLTLSEVVPNERMPKGFECFSMIFQGPREPMLEQAIHQLQQDGAEGLELFLVPVAGDAEGYDYEAVINRKID